MPLYGPPSIRVLGMSAGASSALTGTASETTLATLTIPGNTIGPNGILRIYSLWSNTNNANSKTCRIRLGGLSGTIFAEVANSSIAVVEDFRLIKNLNATNSQITAPAAKQYAGISGSAATLGAVNTTVSQDLVFTGQLANTGDSLTLQMWLVELIQS